MWDSPPGSYQHQAGVWSWDTRVQGSVPQKLQIDEWPARGDFHPLSVAVTNVDPSHENASNPEALTLLLSSQPYAERASVVDVLVHSLRPSARPASSTAATSSDDDHNHDHDPTSTEPARPRSPSPSLIHHTRLTPEHFLLDRLPTQTKTKQQQGSKPLSPYRLTVFREQYSPLLPSDHASINNPGQDDPDAHHLIAIPSFFFSALPDPATFHPSTSGRQFQSGSRSYWQFVLRLLRPTTYASPPRGI